MTAVVARRDLAGFKLRVAQRAVSLRHVE
jgi:hypothetical protein